MRLFRVIDRETRRPVMVAFAQNGAEATHLARDFKLTGPSGSPLQVEIHEIFPPDHSVVLMVGAPKET